MKLFNKELSDIDRIIITHSHEDHDGNLAEILPATQAEVWAHSIYRQMITYHPHIIDGAKHPELPGSCRSCTMPETFYKNCLPYHKERNSVRVDIDIDDNQTLPESNLYFVSTPGHSPDSLCIILDNEVIFTGDTILPQITPHPTLANEYEVNRRVLPEKYRHRNTVYGLMSYIKSLNKIAGMASQPFPITFPAHRLFYNGQFNTINSSSERAKEIIKFHIDRCSDILTIIDGRPSTINDIAIQHFPPSLLSGTGILMAQKEITAHVEVMEECGDICWVGENKDMVENKGSNNYLTKIG